MNTYCQRLTHIVHISRVHLNHEYSHAIIKTIWQEEVATTAWTWMKLNQQPPVFLQWMGVLETKVLGRVV